MPMNVVTSSFIQLQPYVVWSVIAAGILALIAGISGRRAMKKNEPAAIKKHVAWAVLAVVIAVASAVLVVLWWF